ncbi:DUF4253 domain-containing protein [Streptomyces sp. GMY02]|uniref:DUF4253 domain-containing protein n=1 Tax=Streptomyces sp. GMY02 TaxID=1333528 RepID=UPI0020B70DC5|nr:DUF4253 domain-containing protein [Streptomyces sp. GMY02]
MNPEFLRSLGISLPSGLMITSDEGDGGVQPLWLSDEPASAGVWAQIREAHGDSGLWPLLLVPLEHDEEFRPWASGELFPERMSSPESHDPSTVLAQWWKEHTDFDDDDNLSRADRLAVTAPFEQAWPGLAPARETVLDPDEMAAEYAGVFVSERPGARLGLVEAPRGADALAAVGWDGPVNYDDTGKYAAVVRSWEERFGARVVAVGFGTLHLSVAAPPADRDEALAVAAEHFAFCPDNVWQGQHRQALAAYADQLIGVNCWEFWWD